MSKLTGSYCPILVQSKEYEFVIIVIYGTSGELIKIAPLLKKLEGSITINTNQQPHQVGAILEETALPKPTHTVSNGFRGNELSKIWQLLAWFPATVWNLARITPGIRREIRADKHPPLVVVHGDTMTTVIGALYGRLNGFKVAHIEAGLRSHDWRNPFPEEIDRLITSRLARIHFSPGDVPVKNLRDDGAKGEVINTQLNTVLDSMLMARSGVIGHGVKGLPKKYGVVSIHRNELMAKPDVLKQLIETLDRYSSKTPLVFLDHPVTKARLTELGYDRLFTKKEFIRVPKQSYFKFMKLLAKADFVVTDSGGLQEECAYINTPCLLHRLATEREEGLGANVLLSKFDDGVVRGFMDDPSKFKGVAAKDEFSPTDVILNYLKTNSYK